MNDAYQVCLKGEYSNKMKTRRLINKLIILHPKLLNYEAMKMNKF